jgi:hypothetical protein
MRDWPVNGALPIITRYYRPTKLYNGYYRLFPQGYSRSKRETNNPPPFVATQACSLTSMRTEQVYGKQANTEQVHGKQANTEQVHG